MGFPTATARRHARGMASAMTAYSVKCQACGNEITGESYHPGFRDMDALYCSSCPGVLLLKDRNLPGRFGIRWPDLQVHDPGFRSCERHLLPVFGKIEVLFQSCACGGHYGYLNPPRCPDCDGLLRGGLYADTPVLKRNDRYVFVTVGISGCDSSSQAGVRPAIHSSGAPKTAQP
jgi:hypothetical protein